MLEFPGASHLREEKVVIRGGWLCQWDESQKEAKGKSHLPIAP